MTHGLRWGVLGTGFAADLFVRDLVRAGFDVRAVGSRDAEAGRRFARAHGVPVAHGSYPELVASSDLDVIYVSSPHPLHRDHAMLALLAGKHVLLEKPFALNRAEAEEIVATADDLGLVVLEAMWTRWLPHMLRIHEIIDQGTIGELVSVTAEHSQWLSDDPAHRLNSLELGGGALLDLGIYPVSFASDLLGAPLEVRATSTPTSTGVDAQTAAVIRYGGDRLALVHCALNAPGANRAVVTGTRGRIEIDEVWYAATSFTVFDAQGGATERFESDVDGRGMHFQATELERLVSTGSRRSPRMPSEESIAIMATLDDIRAQIDLVYPGEDPARRPVR
ncbi:Gfo/Idh/MocA family protein [uncultured Amnibacterium sp.]|uniref:Gfo/Idh/MocA family protein n=1 Tax=uncultured Amnibacterium sp. TaxID=1631851 RepID=UPI0035CA1537